MLQSMLSPPKIKILQGIFLKSVYLILTYAAATLLFNLPIGGRGCAQNHSPTDAFTHAQIIINNNIMENMIMKI